MGWRSAIRTINSAARKAERAAIRRQIELERLRQQQHKMEELERAAFEVDLYENHIEIIQSLHKEYSEPINWAEIIKHPEPKKPKRFNDFEKEALLEKENYKPSFFDRIFNLIHKKIRNFDVVINDAKIKDEKINELITNEWRQLHYEWEENIIQAKLITSGNPNAKIQVIEELKPFSELSDLGSKFNFSINKNGLLTITFHIHSNMIVPKEEKSLLKSGKLSTKKMPIGKFNEIFQDYVCSATLRVASVLFAILPDNQLKINVIDTSLNKVTGHVEDKCILSIYIPKNDLLALNMNEIDPSDSMQNFIHRMSFKRNKGFDSIEPLNIEK